MANMVKSFDELNKIKLHCDMKIQILYREYEHSMQSGEFIENEEAAEITDEKNQMEVILQTIEMLFMALADEEEEWNGSRYELDGDQHDESASFIEFDNEYNEILERTSQIILENSECMQEMQLFFDPAVCNENKPLLASQINSNGEEFEKLSKRLKTLQEKADRLAMKSERRRVTEIRYPVERVKQFILKEARKQRHSTAVKLMEIRLESRNRIEPTEEDAGCLEEENEENTAAMAYDDEYDDQMPGYQYM